MKIVAKNIVKTYRKRRVVDGISLEVKQGEIVGLLGPNGAGKTTSFYMMVGLVKPNEGHVFLDNDDVTDQPMYRRAQMGIGYLAQEASVFRKLSVEDNILAVLEMTDMSKKEQYEKLCKPIGYKVEYIYLLNDWFNQKVFDDVFKYINSVGCSYYIGALPLNIFSL